MADRILTAEEVVAMLGDDGCECATCLLARSHEALRQALAAELAEWNPEERPMLVDRLEAAEVALKQATDALEDIASGNQPGYLANWQSGRSWRIQLARDTLAAIRWEPQP